MEITKDIYYVGVDDFDIKVFEGQFPVENGMAYNSYAIIDKKVAVCDTVEKSFGDKWLDNLRGVLGEREPNYLVVHHMEPDHSANIDLFMDTFTSAKIVATEKTFKMIEQFFGDSYNKRMIVVKEGDELTLGEHILKFYTAPMIHWPEVMVSYDITSKTLFSADAFGKFGVREACEDWACEARRYYFGIVGKYGAQVQTLLKKLSSCPLERICALHGPILTENLSYYVNLYDIWSSYAPEKEGITIAYTSVYGNTKKAVMLLKEELLKAGCTNVSVFNLGEDDVFEAVEDAFKYNKLVLATTTYNGSIFPYMKQFIDHLTERSYQKRKIAVIENGTWAPMAEKTIKKMFENSKDIEFSENTVKILSAVSKENKAQIEILAKELVK